MPLHADPLSRRSFLTHGTACIAGAALCRQTWGADGVNPNRIALLSDTHIPSRPDIVARDTNMTANLKQVVGELIALSTKPAGVFINGDCAYLKGLPDDYANLAECVAPLTAAGLPLHVTMGNHDDRGPLFTALTNQKPARPILDSKHVSVIETPHARWFLLDSLTQTDVVTGEIGVEQRAWLAKALAAHRDKPALVIAHHTPQFEPPEEGKPWWGIQDTAEFLELLSGFDHVQAFVFGHSHDWSQKRHGKLHLINLPPVAYVFAAGKPNGWVMAETRADGLDLELRTIDKSHPQNLQRVELTWS